ncbi:MAG: hypothetical protein JW881_10090 [Spirochaetales bacterium]|nr:hypothetical protein [Spirochaetales bacterium]
MKRIAVRYHENTGEEEIEKIEKDFHLKRIKRIPVLRIYSYKASEDVKNRLKTHPSVRYVEDEQKMKADGKA